jgi:hypothetical protein
MQRERERGYIRDYASPLTVVEKYAVLHIKRDYVSRTHIIGNIITYKREREERIYRERERGENIYVTTHRVNT